MQCFIRGFLFFFLLLPGVLLANVTMTAPSDAPAGSEIVLEFDGELGNKDFVTIVKAAEDEGKYAAYLYVRSKNTMTFRVPEDAGDYEIRYLDANPPYPTRASQPLTVTPVEATVQAIAEVEAGATFEVVWTGPDNPQDFIALSDPNDERGNRKWISYVYTRKGSPLSMLAPDKPGSYQVQYRTGVKYYTLAETTVVVAGTTASVTAPDNVQAGQHFEVTWSGPDNPQDFIAISAKDSDVRQYHHYSYTKQGSTVTLHAPDEPGIYEVRYQTGQSYAILAKHLITVEAVTATLEAPEEVQGGVNFDVIWTGPDNPGDFIAIMEVDADKRAPAKGQWAYAHYGSPAELRAPLEPAEYEIRYQTGQSGNILAKRTIRVTPPSVAPGQLTVMLDSGVSGFATGDAVEIILDASGSMLKKQDGKRRIEIAREVLLGLTGEVIPEGTPFALRVFGHKEADSCRTDLEEALAPLNVEKVETKLRGLQAMNLAKTPIARSLELVNDDLASVTGERVVILVTDGEETCDGDPAAVLEAMKAKAVDVRVNIVGFAIDDENLKSRFRYWANLANGEYYDAISANDLERSMNHALQVPYDVFDATGKLVASGTVGDDGVDLSPGEYTVKTRSTAPLQATASIVSDKKSGVVLK